MISVPESVIRSSGKENMDHQHVSPAKTSANPELSTWFEKSYLEASNPGSTSRIVVNSTTNSLTPAASAALSFMAVRIFTQSASGLQTSSQPQHQHEHHQQPSTCVISGLWCRVKQQYHRIMIHASISTAVALQ